MLISWIYWSWYLASIKPCRNEISLRSSIIWLIIAFCSFNVASNSSAFLMSSAWLFSVSACHSLIRSWIAFICSDVVFLFHSDSNAWRFSSSSAWAIPILMAAKIPKPTPSNKPIGPRRLSPPATAKEPAPNATPVPTIDPTAIPVPTAAPPRATPTSAATPPALGFPL